MNVIKLDIYVYFLSVNLLFSIRISLDKTPLIMSESINHASNFKLPSMADASTKINREKAPDGFCIIYRIGIVFRFANFLNLKKEKCLVHSVK